MSTVSFLCSNKHPVEVSTEKFEEWIAKPDFHYENLGVKCSKCDSNILSYFQHSFSGTNYSIDVATILAVHTHFQDTIMKNKSRGGKQRKYQRARNYFSYILKNRRKHKMMGTAFLFCLKRKLFNWQESGSGMEKEIAKEFIPKFFGW